MNHGVWPGLVLLAYIPVIIFLFVRFSPVKAAAMTLLGAAMFLPEHAAYDLPVLPAFDKRTIPAIVATIILVRDLPKRVLKVPLQFLLVLGALNILGGIGTLLTNRETYVIGVMKPVVLPGLRLNDLAGLFSNNIVYYFLPFFIGSVTVTSFDSAKVALRILVKAGLLFSLFCLFEVRMSPQLHVWIYGYAAHGDFAQAMRWGGYRPSVFFYHGLVAAFFLLLTTLGAATCVRAGIGVRPLNRWTLLYLVVVLILCKSTGAIAYSIVFLPLLLATKPRTQIAVCALICAVVATFPYSRTTGLFPVDTLVEWASALSEDRAGSLLYRFTNEDALLDRLYSFGKEWFGWGGYRRAHIFDPWTGDDLTVLDGQWIILVVERGVVGMFVVFGLLLWPVWKVWKHRRLVPSGAGGIIVAGLTVLVTVGAAEMLPNAPNISVHFWLAGCLYGLTRSLEANRSAMMRATQAGRVSS